MSDADLDGDIPHVPPGDYVVIEIEDTGCGMTADVERHAFEPFYTTKAVGQGTGLGLSQVIGFATQSGGTARLASGIGRGTCVMVYLPQAAICDADVVREPVQLEVLT